MWLYYFDLPIDWRQYPIVVIRYRARNLDTSSRNYFLWMDDGTDPNRGGFHAFQQRDLVADERIREARKELRAEKPVGAIEGIALGMLCGEQSPAVVEVGEYFYMQIFENTPRT